MPDKVSGEITQKQYAYLNMAEISKESRPILSKQLFSQRRFSLEARM